MKPQPKFELKNPSNKEEKLIVELIKDLNEVTHVFMKLNNPGIVTQEIFVVLRDASIGYAGAIVRDLIKILIKKDQKIEFCEEAKRIFNCYMDQIKEDFK